jgi:AcrR family transcriptional regulator
MSIKTTKDVILKSALEVFLEKGFAGASISQIAKIAKINQSLIYHHFKSKEDLWSCVKKFCVDEATHNFKPLRFNTLENFIEDLINVRLLVYSQGNMRKLIHWQSLETQPSQFYENMQAHPLFDIGDHVKILQKNNLIRTDKDAEILSAIIFSLSSYAFFDFASVFSLSDEQQKNYKKLIFEILINALSPSSSMVNDSKIIK